MSDAVPTEYDAEADDLRGTITRYIAAQGMTTRSVAALTGVPDSTFSAWLSGSYKGNNDKIEDKARVWFRSHLLMGRMRQTLPADLPFVRTPTAAKFLDALEYAQAMPDLVVIVGGAGVGKTTSCIEYRATHPNVWHLTAEPSLASARKMMEYLREMLGLPETATHKLSRSIAAKLQGTQGLIIIDEAQHLTMVTLDQLRSIHDRAGVGLALVGNEQVLGRMSAGSRAEYAQLSSRVGMKKTVARSSAGDIATILDAAGVEDPAQRGWLKSIANKPGALRQMTKTLRLARRLAAGGSEPLAEAHIVSAWNRLSDQDTAP